MNTQIKGRWLGLCTCGQSIYVNTEHGAVIHGVPYCEKFRDLEPDEFLIYIRRSRGIPDPPEES